MRFRARLVFECDYDVNPKNYGTDDVPEMLKIDQKNLEDDPMSMVSEDDCIEATVTLISE